MLFMLADAQESSTHIIASRYCGIVIKAVASKAAVAGSKRLHSAKGVLIAARIPRTHFLIRFQRHESLSTLCMAQCLILLGGESS